MLFCTFLFFPHIFNVSQRSLHKQPIEILLILFNSFILCCVGILLYSASLLQVGIGGFFPSVLLIIVYIVSMVYLWSKFLEVAYF